ncbi:MULTISPECIES: hypothetical protein [unclassified Streptomyces]|uniref:hypothetical protein n=1 Tax=unclassified Streptomyces TaxID=2593676 RepID=UPI0033C0640A
MRIRTALAVTALTAAAVLGASGTALAHGDYDQGSVAFENVGGPAGITEGAGHFAGGHDEDGHGDGWKAGFAFENLGGPAGITKGAGYGAGFDGQHHD